MKKIPKAVVLVPILCASCTSLIFLSVLPFCRSAMAAEQLDAISRQDVKAGISNQTLILVDVREPDEFKAGHIPGAQSFPLSSFNPGALPKIVGKVVVFYCHSGRRARIALAKVQAAGLSLISQVYAGSMTDWEAAKESIEK